MTPDSWRPGATLDTLRRRAVLLQAIRDFFAARDVLEVETPVLGHAGSTELHLDALSLDARTPAGRERLWLQTSPEYHMKRLLAVGSGPIFQLARVFRDGESGRRHNLEFTMLEWYRPGWTLAALIEEVAALVGEVTGRSQVPLRKRPYRELFVEHLGVDPLIDSAESLAALRQLAARHGGAQSADWSRDDCCDLLMSLVIEPELGQGGPEAVIDYPASQASLARRQVDAQGAEVAARFELYLDGVELANGFDELTDAAEQRARFDEDNARRRQLGLDPVAPDEALLAALAHGMPPACGVALGADRLIMLALGLDSLEESLAFDTLRC
ncbi:EF-P lysine aminoacylase EpmA [Kushneria aurantia]|uniref:EF-P lysine aminoacylase EpmA n=1 Tax=Kushneria aurantia TaxID=504092 RepID=A0ABV6G6N3_9GAMM|nr:EF-P lysine aminoacylase EpmA [Kushneria aurantia]